MIFDLMFATKWYLFEIFIQIVQICWILNSKELALTANKNDIYIEIQYANAIYFGFKMK